MTAINASTMSRPIQNRGDSQPPRPASLTATSNPKNTQDKTVSPMMSKRWPSTPGAVPWMVNEPAMPMHTNRGRTPTKIARQDHTLVIMPPYEGPSAGAKEMITAAKPVYTPSLRTGTWAKIVWNIRGVAMPVAIAWSMRPNSSRANPGATRQMSEPMILVASAKKNSARGLNRLSKYAVLPMTIVTSSRYPVASHCTVASGTCMLRMSTGKSTVIEVSMRIPTKESMPMDTMAARVRQGTGESAVSRFAGRRSVLCSVLPASFGCCSVLSGIVLLVMALSSFVVICRRLPSCIVGCRHRS